MFLFRPSRHCPDFPMRPVCSLAGSSVSSPTLHPLLFMMAWMPLSPASRSSRALASSGGGVVYASPVRGSHTRGSILANPCPPTLPDAGCANMGAASCRLRSTPSSSSNPRTPSNLPRPASRSCTSSTACWLVHTTRTVLPGRTPEASRVAATPSPGRLSSLPDPKTFWYAASAPVTSRTMLSRASKVRATSMAKCGTLCPSYDTVIRASLPPSSGLGSLFASGALCCFRLGAPALPSAMEKSMGAIIGVSLPSL
mmetsp:Transcript_26028/g.65693  ORF Transcript_26028/g.65693 Transcript_26028/m.65693 type:complete len:255 (-) Transcript_26028:97-861(-)